MISLVQMSCDHYPFLECSLQLENKELWQQFANFETEMILTKDGRCLFPSLKIRIERLKPHSFYKLSIRMARLAKCRYYNKTWTYELFRDGIEHYSKAYVYTNRLQSGVSLMRKPINFNKLKITNNQSIKNHIPLQSFNQYRPEFLIEEYDSNGTCVLAKNLSTFAGTEFIAVTAYHNRKIIDLKINYNPFAKRFRGRASKITTFQMDFLQTLITIRLATLTKHNRCKTI